MNSFIRIFGHGAARFIANASIYGFFIAGLLYLLINIFSPKGVLTYGIIGFLVCLVLCLPGGMLLSSLEKHSKNLVRRISQKEGLFLNEQYLLGLPSHKYFAFDVKHRKIAACDSANDTYKIHDFSFIIRWHTNYDTVIRGEVGLGGNPTPGTPMQGPTYREKTQYRNFRLVLEVNDLNCPIVNISMRSNDEALQWHARLNAIFNG